MNDKAKQLICYQLKQLSYSKFRSHFHLKEKDVEYCINQGLTVIEQHAYDFVKKRLSPRYIMNDGKQTPMKGHPVFIAQHATATCCRGCLYKWYHIEKNKELNLKEEKFIVALIMEWIQQEIYHFNKK